MKNWFSQNLFGVGLLIASLVVGFSATYYYTIFLPQKEQHRTQIEETKLEAERQEKLTGALRERQMKEEKQECFVKATEVKERVIRAENSVVMNGQQITRVDYDKVFSNEYGDCLMMFGLK